MILMLASQKKMLINSDDFFINFCNVLEKSTDALLDLNSARLEIDLFLVLNLIRRIKIYLKL